MNTLRTAAAATLLGLALGACGQKGPLYLPEDAPAATRGGTATAPAAIPPLSTPATPVPPDDADTAPAPERDEPKPTR